MLSLYMNQWIMIKFLVHCFIFLIFTIDVEAQMPQSPPDSNNFQPSLALVIGFLSIMFVLTIILLLYAKFCHRGPASVGSASLRIRDGLFRSRSRASGVDKAVVESLPFFRFSSLRGSRDGLDCLVCLSKFEDVEILRLLPKCKHAFHIDCIDQWLEKHSTCPICRRKISPEDVSELLYSNSLRFLRSQSGEVRDESNIELHVQREENGLGSSRFSIGRSLRWLSHRGIKEGDLPPKPRVDSDQFKKRFHRFNHRVLGYSDIVFKKRWSNLSSSDLAFLNSEFLNDKSSARFTSKKSMEVEEIHKENDQMMSTLISKTAAHSFLNFPGLPTTSDSANNLESGSNFRYPVDKRSMSEIVVHPRFTELKDDTDSFLVENSESERVRRLWISIARKTLQRFTNRELKPPNPQSQ